MSSSHDRAIFRLIDDLECQLAELSAECAENRRRIYLLEDKKESSTSGVHDVEPKTVRKTFR